MRLRDAMLSSALQQSATLLLLFGTGIVIAHLLTPREAGSYSVAMATASLVAVLKDSAIGSYVVSAPQLDDGLLRAAFGLSLTIAACLTIGFIGLSFPLANFYQDPALGEALRIVALGQLGPAAVFPATVRLLRAMRFGTLLAIGLAAAASQSLISITLAALGHGAAALAWGYVTSSVVMAVMTMAYQPDTMKVRPTLAGSGRLLAFGGWMSATLLVGSTATSAPELMIGRALGIANAALFSRAQNLVSVVRTGVLFGLTKPLLPSLGKRESEGAGLAPIYLRIVESVSGVAWPAYAVLAIWAEPLVRTLYGEAWSAAGTMIAPIAIAHGLALTVTPHFDILIVKRRQRLLFVSEFAHSSFTILALGIGLTIGIEAALWSLVLSSAFFATWYFVVLKVVVGFTPSALFKAWSRSLAVTFIAIPVPLAFRHLGGQGAVEVMLEFAVSSAIAMLIWIAGVMFIRHELALHIGPPLNKALASITFRLFPRFLAAAKKSMGRSGFT
jgi:O-antigen/teichoic acid export membrane protein